MSAAEQASRKNLLSDNQSVTASNAQEPPPEQTGSQSSTPMRDADSASRPKDSNTNSQSRLPRIPRHLRATDWDCPDCNYRCFGKHRECPACRAPRPELVSTSKVTDKSHKRSAPARKSESRSTAEEEQRGKNIFDDDFRAFGATTSARDEAPQTLTAPSEDRPASKSRGKTREERTKGRKAEQEALEAAEEAAEAERWRNYEPDESLTEYLRAQKEKKMKKGRRQKEFDDEDEDFDDLDEFEKRKEKRRMKKRKESDAPRPLYLPEFISVSNLADVLGVRPAQFVERMEEMGFENVTFSHILDAETAGLIATEYNFEPIFDSGEEDLRPAPPPEDPSSLPPRPPVVTIMGHVDHGKTTLLDWLRKSSVAASEHGGITQHIGAFSVSMPSGKSITFLDTPGHEAFLSMRRRGADVTDIVVLVVAADDSVKPQTIEAIKHAKEANVPMIVAINKIDKEGVQPERVKQDLARHGVTVEDYGGDVQSIPVSGKTGQGMGELEEAIVALSEMLDHRADRDGNAEGWIIESSTKKAGRVATVLVKRGTIRPGDILVAGTTWTKVRTLRNEAGTLLKEVSPGLPCEIDGWRELPEAGSIAIQAPNEQRAKEVVEYRQERLETKKLSEDATAINESRREMLEARRAEQEADDNTPSDTVEAHSGPKPVKFMVKADVAGSMEAVVNAMTGIGNNEVYAHVLRSGVGSITEFDVKHASMADADIVNFNLPVDPSISRAAEFSGVKILNHTIIYELIDDVKDKVSEHLPPNVSQRVTGEAEVGQIFEITVKGRTKTKVAGCKVRNGIISRSKKVRVLRGKEVIYDGKFLEQWKVKYLLC